MNMNKIDMQLKYECINLKYERFIKEETFDHPSLESKTLTKEKVNEYFELEHDADNKEEVMENLCEVTIKDEYMELKSDSINYLADKNDKIKEYIEFDEDIHIKDEVGDSCSSKADNNEQMKKFKQIASNGYSLSDEDMRINVEAIDDPSETKNPDDSLVSELNASKQKQTRNRGKKYSCKQCDYKAALFTILRSERERLSSLIPILKYY